MSRTRPSVRYITRQLNAVRSVVAVLLFTSLSAAAQNSMIGDGFGGRLWYRPTNYTVGSYSAFSLCYSDPCDSSSNQLYGWGSDNVDELGNGPGAVCSNVPVAIPSMSNVRYFSTGYWMGVIKNDGTGWVWGTGGPGGFNVPTQVITDVKFVDGSGALASFIKNDGTVWSIGYNEFGQFGDGTVINNYSVPVQMIGVTGAVRVAVGLRASYVLLADSSVLSVGSNEYGLLGNTSLQDPLITTPIPITGLTGILDIKATWNATAALAANGDVYSWGQGGYTGDGDELNDTVPKRVAGLSNIVAISGCTDGDHFLALDVDRNCYAYGFYNVTGNWNTYYLEPFLLATDVIDIMAGETFSYIVKADGTLWAAGWSLCGSVFLDQPNHGGTDPLLEFTQLDPSAVAGSCPLIGTTAIPSATCSSGTITVYHFGGQEPYMYDIGTGPQSSNVFTNVPLGNYTVSVADANGCVIAVPCMVDPGDPAPVIIDMGTVYACRNEGYTLPSGTTVYPPGTYSDTTFSVLGCDTVRMIEVLTQWLNWQIDLCEGEPFTLPNGNVAYAPSYHEVNAVLDTLLYPSPCDTTNSITLVLSNLSPIGASIFAQDSVVTLGESVDLVGAWGSSYSWTPSSTLSCSSCPNPSATPTETTEYCVAVGGGAAGGIGCGSDMACITITVLTPAPPICSGQSIYVPNAFSPNNSGMNDGQCLYGTECVTSMTFNIFDRWGNKVFESTDAKACWDGTYNGQALDPAVFVYQLNATLANGEVVERQGNISLIR